MRSCAFNCLLSFVTVERRPHAGYLAEMELTGDYYATLRVVPDAESAAIRMAYRNLMRRYHPDVNRSEEAGNKATAINEAYACLRDPAERAAYDRRRYSRQMSEGSAGATQPWHIRPSVWGAGHAYIVEVEPQFQPSWWKAVGLGLATLVTIVTFAMTSATPAAGPPSPNSIIMVKTNIRAKNVIRPDGTHCNMIDVRTHASC